MLTTHVAWGEMFIHKLDERQKGCKKPTFGIREPCCVRTAMAEFECQTWILMGSNEVGPNEAKEEMLSQNDSFSLDSSRLFQHARVAKLKTFERTCIDDLLRMEHFGSL